MKPPVYVIAIVFAVATGGCAELLPSASPSRASRSTAPAAGAAAKTSLPAAPSPSSAPSSTGTYRVTIGVTSASGRLGAVQFDARARGGDWQGAGASVGCRNVAGAAMMACNDKGNGLLSCALIDQSGFSTPGSLVVCNLSSSKPPAASDIAVKATDASTPGMKPANVTLAVTGVAAN